MYDKQKPNSGWYRIQKQVEQSKLEWVEYGIPEIRTKSFKGVIFWHEIRDTVPRSSGRDRSWKHHRKTQYK